MVVKPAKPVSKWVIILVIFSGLILLAGGFTYYFYYLKQKPSFVAKQEPQLVYSITVDSEKSIRLIPRPRFAKNLADPGLNLYFSREATDVSQYQRIDILNPAKLSLRLLEELDEKGLLIVMGRQGMANEQKGEIRYRELAILEETAKPDGASGYLIEVEKLAKGKRYILCDWATWRPHPRRYFFTFIRQ